MRNLILGLVYFSFLVGGFRFSLIFLLGYAWVDIVTPQLVDYGLLRKIPVSLIMALCLIAGSFLLPKEKTVRIRTVTVLTAVFALWMTLSLSWAVVPDDAFGKWNWAIKSVIISCFIPFYLRDRTSLEAFIWVIFISGMAHCIPFGIKVLFSGGGYGQALGLVADNSGYGEGSTLSMFSVSLIPIALYLMKHNTLMPGGKLVKIGLIGASALALLSALGTFARTGLICSAVLGLFFIFRSKRKLFYLIIVILLAMSLPLIMGDAWVSRMGSIGNKSEESSMGRVAVWLWTIDYVSHNPLGGSFETYQINRFEMMLENGTLLTVQGKAFHNIYFEVLGELGIPGIILYLLIITISLINFRRIQKQKNSQENSWINDMSTNLFLCMVIFLVGGNFIGVAFQSYFYYLVAIGAGLLNVQEKNSENLKNS